MPAATGSQARRTRFGVVRLEEGDAGLEIIAGNGDERGGRVERKGSWEELMQIRDIYLIYVMEIRMVSDTWC
jgi:hypothetical protein